MDPLNFCEEQEFECAPAFDGNDVVLLMGQSS